MAMNSAESAGRFLRCAPPIQSRLPNIREALSLKAFLLAAGHGTRLRPLTDGIPKCLVPIRGVPMLQIWLELCHLYGIDRVLINLHAHADQVRAFLRHRHYGPPVEVVEEPELLGRAGTLL